MQQLIPVLAALGGVLALIAGYHVRVASPHWRRLAVALATHDGLLGAGGAGPATKRLELVEAAVRTAAAERAALALRAEALERIARSETPRIGFVRYNAFDDVGSDLSYALALLTREGDGVVLSSIYSREETRTYGKAVTRFQTAQDASSEEIVAIARARAAAT